MDTFHYKTYIHILLSGENSLICPHLEKVYFILISCFQEAIRRHISVYPCDLNVTRLVNIRWSQYAWICH